MDLFIEEQFDYREFRYSYLSEFDCERLVWIPISRRHSCYTFKPNPYGKRLWG